MSPILGHFLLAMAAPNLTDMQIGENVYQASHAVMVQTACMIYQDGSDGGDVEADTNPANWPVAVRSTISFARKQGASLNPTRDQCLHLMVAVQRELDK